MALVQFHTLAARGATHVPAGGFRPDLLRLPCGGNRGIAAGVVRVVVGFVEEHKQLQEKADMGARNAPSPPPEQEAG